MVFFRSLTINHRCSKHFPYKLGCQRTVNQLLFRHSQGGIGLPVHNPIFFCLAIDRLPVRNSHFIWAVTRVALVVPDVLSTLVDCQGATKLIHLSLNEMEQQQLHHSAQVLQEIISQLDL
ncbi:MAG: hypothetical protein J7524_05895 [Roseofilum sp. Belize BBD 4]|uniref:hypothetical protein n=1 Tax=unclassified Roseofilum TaxID=2620099 RepID=UPI001B0D9187|nr:MULTISPECIES: hypothetical protein [unclassified Roseofilum]MBP0032687.1 hypothetical protein [Roseofilum sp. Belize BBD 4]